MNGFDSTTILGQRRRAIFSVEKGNYLVVSTIARCEVCGFAELEFDPKSLRLFCPLCPHDEKL